MSLPLVTYAAIRTDDGKVFLGKRHAELILQAVRSGYYQTDAYQLGFVDAEGAFLTRAEAYQRAVATGQLQDTWVIKELHSEMLW